MGLSLEKDFSSMAWTEADFVGLQKYEICRMTFFGGQYFLTPSFLSQNC